MVRSRIGVVLAGFALVATSAEAQLPIFSGVITGNLGVASGGDVRDWTVMPGASIAVLDERGLGVEVDVSHGGDFDTSQFADSSITTVTLNFIAMYPHEMLRPFVTVGAGATRVRVAFLPDQGSVGQTDSVWSAGGGLVYMLTEALAFRGDVRYFRNFSRQNLIPLGDNGALNFVRTSFGVAFTWPIH